MAMKKCKECGAEISSSAKTCPNCGKKQTSILKIIIILIIVIIIIAAIAGGGSSTENEIPDNISYTAVDVDTLDAALESNAAAAKDTYNGQYLEITGRLGTIDSDLQYISLLSTTDEWDLNGIHCTIQNDEQREIIKTLTVGDTIKVKGKITDVGEVLGYYLDITEISK